MDPKQILRQQIEAVFRLGGGELDDSLLVYTADGGPEQTFRWHYEGVPGYASEDHPDQETLSDGSNRFEFFTAIVGGLSPNPQKIRLFGNDKPYELVALYSSSGETECPAKDCEKDPFPNADCPLCDCEAGDPHDFVYLGPDWGEAVYRHDRLAWMKEVAAKAAVRVWEASKKECEWCGDVAPGDRALEHEACPEDANVKTSAGRFFWWETCHPGCLPDSGPFGPFDSEVEALADGTDGLLD